MPTGPRRPARKKHQAKHTVVVHVAAPDGFVDLRLVKWTIRVAAPPARREIISSIRLAPRPPKFKKRADLREWQAQSDSASVLDYRSDDPNVKRRVDALVRKLRAGWLPATTGATGQTRKQHKQRALIQEVLQHLLMVLTETPPPVLADRSMVKRFLKELDRATRPIAEEFMERPYPPLSLDENWRGGGVFITPKLEKQSKEITNVWAQLKEAHHHAAEGRDEKLDQIIDALVMGYPPLMARGDDIQAALASSDPRDFIRRSVRRRNRLRRNQLRRILGKRVGDQDATRFGYEAPYTLAVALAAMMFHCSKKTVRRVAADLLS